MTESCKTCKYKHKLKRMVNHKWIYEDICTVLIETEKDTDGTIWALEVTDNDMCEMYSEREEKNEQKSNKRRRTADDT